MRRFDRFLQQWRARVARPWVPLGAKVLDIGCHQGEFLASLGEQIGPSVGLDPLAQEATNPRFRLLAESFREPLPFPEASFDAVVMLATLEHIREVDPLTRECRRLLRPNGRVIITVPSPRVDQVLQVLRFVRLVDGMSLEEHHGFDPRDTLNLFTRHGFEMEHRRRFQLGLNHLFVFKKPAPKLASDG
jgi:SAM-dependent methyltransferase